MFSLLFKLRKKESKIVIQREFQARSPFAASAMSLARLNLTALYFVECLSHLTLVDLSGNRLTRIGRNFNEMLTVRTLILDRNQIEKVESGVRLGRLQTLRVEHNRESRIPV